MAALPVLMEQVRQVRGGPQLRQGDAPGGAFAVGEQFQKEAPGFVHFSAQNLPRQKYSVCVFLLLICQSKVYLFFFFFLVGLFELSATPSTV